SQFLQRLDPQTIAIFQAIRQMEPHGHVEDLKQLPKDRGGRDAVGIVVAVDADRLLLLDRFEQMIDRGRNTGKQFRRMQPGERGIEKSASVFWFGQPAVEQKLRGDRRDPQRACQPFDRVRIVRQQVPGFGHAGQRVLRKFTEESDSTDQFSPHDEFSTCAGQVIVSLPGRIALRVMIGFPRRCLICAAFRTFRNSVLCRTRYQRQETICRGRRPRPARRSERKEAMKSLPMTRALLGVGAVLVLVCGCRHCQEQGCSSCASCATSAPGKAMVMTPTPAKPVATSPAPTVQLPVAPVAPLSPSLSIPPVVAEKYVAPEKAIVIAQKPPIDETAIPNVTKDEPKEAGSLPDWNKVVVIQRRSFADITARAEFDHDHDYAWLVG